MVGEWIQFCPGLVSGSWSALGLLSPVAGDVTLIGADPISGAVPLEPNPDQFVADPLKPAGESSTPSRISLPATRDCLYSSFLFQASLEIGAYRSMMQRELYGIDLTPRVAAEDTRVKLFWYLDRRFSRPEEDWEISAQEACRAMARKFLGHIVDVNDMKLEVEYFARKIAAVEDGLWEKFAEIVKRDFPLALRFREGIVGSVSWNDIEQLRRFCLPQRAHGEKPKLMIVGIGVEWDLVEKYAARGYHLVLVDPSLVVAQFFMSRRPELQALERRYGVQIRFVPQKVQSREIAFEFGGTMDSIENHNMSENVDSEIFFHLLKPGGVEICFCPFEIEYFGREDSELIRHFKNVPAVLGTWCEKRVYPAGNHILILKKVG